MNEQTLKSPNDNMLKFLPYKQMGSLFKFNLGEFKDKL